MVRRVLQVVLGVGLSLTLAGVTAELAVRLLNPVPRTQVVRESAARHLYQLGGVELWQGTDPEIADLVDADCDAAHRVSFVGDSILQVSSVEPSPNFVTPLRAALGPGWCVHNRAQAGFVAVQKGAVALDEIAVRRPDVLVWEVWGERGRVARFGDTAINTGGYTVDEAGYPILPGLPLPSVLHHAAFRHLRAWRYAVLALGATSRFDDVLPVFDRVLAAARAEGVTLVLVFFPELERPFGQPSPVVDEVQERVWTWGQAHDVPMVDVGRAFEGRVDHEAVRLDPCCHYNKRGHAELAQLFATLVDDLADGRLDVTPGRGNSPAAAP